MPNIVSMDSAALERLVDARLKAARDGTPAPVADINPRPRAESEDDNREEPQGLATRGTTSGLFGRQSTLKPEQARNILAFLRGFINHDHTEMRRAMTDLGERATTLQQVGVSADGGATLPSLFSNEVLIDLPRVTPFADPGIVRIIPMENETLRWTRVTARPSQPSSTREGVAYTKTGVSFGPITLVAKKIGEIIPFTEEILGSNAIGMVQVVSSLVSDAFGFKYNSLVTSGLNNADEPEGVLTNSNITATSFITTNDQTKADSFISIFQSMPSQYRQLGGIWLMNDLDITIARKLKDTQGRYLWNDTFGQFAQGRPATLLGRPVFENPDLPQGTVLFGNFLRGYVIGQREGMTIQVNSSGSDWEKDITNYKFRQRWDGRVHDEKAFVKGTGLA